MRLICRLLFNVFWSVRVFDCCYVRSADKKLHRETEILEKINLKKFLEKFPRSQHRPSLITPARFAMAVPRMPFKRWNFRKAKWSHYIALTNKFAKTLLPPDSLDVDATYQDFCNTIKKAAKNTIPRGYRNNYIPCWDAECKSLYKTFLQSPQGDDSSLAATALLAKLDRKRRDRWSEAVWSINFSHSSRKA